MNDFPRLLGTPTSCLILPQILTENMSTTIQYIEFLTMNIYSIHIILLADNTATMNCVTLNFNLSEYSKNSLNKM